MESHSAAKDIIDLKDMKEANQETSIINQQDLVPTQEDEFTTYLTPPKTEELNEEDNNQEVTTLKAAEESKAESSNEENKSDSIPLDEGRQVHLNKIIELEDDSIETPNFESFMAQTHSNTHGSLGEKDTKSSFKPPPSKKESQSTNEDTNKSPREDCEEVKSLRATNQKLTQQVKEMQAKISELAQELAESVKYSIKETKILEEEIERVKALLIKFRKEKAELQTQLNETQAILAQKEQELVQNNRAKVEREFNNYKERVTKELLEKGQQLQSKSDALTETQNKLSQLEGRFKNSEVNSANTVIKYKDELKTLEKQHEANKDELDRTKTQLKLQTNRLEAKIQTLEMEIQRLNEERGQKMTQYQNHVKELTAQITENEGALHELRKQIHGTNLTHGQEIRQKDMIIQELSTSSKTFEQIEAKLIIDKNYLSHKMEDLKDENKRLELKKSMLQEELNSMAKEQKFRVQEVVNDYDTQLRNRESTHQAQLKNLEREYKKKLREQSEDFQMKQLQDRSQHAHNNVRYAIQLGVVFVFLGWMVVKFVYPTIKS